MNTTFLLILLLSVLQTLTTARITSLGLETAQGTRNGLQSSDFLIQFSETDPIVTPNFTVEAADLSTFPSLGGTDTQFFFARLSLKSGASFITHYHPRGAESVIVLRGVFRITIIDEGLAGARRFTNRVRTGEILAIPTGLIHEIDCISSRDCVFVAQFNTADPGIIGV